MSGVAHFRAGYCTSYVTIYGILTARHITLKVRDVNYDRTLLQVGELIDKQTELEKITISLPSPGLGA